MRKYCIELVNNGTVECILQSKWFRNKQNAIDWAKTQINYIDNYECSLFVMIAEVDNKDNYEVVDREKIELYEGEK